MFESLPVSSLFHLKRSGILLKNNASILRVYDKAGQGLCSKSYKRRKISSFIQCSLELSSVEVEALSNVFEREED